MVDCGRRMTGTLYGPIHIAKYYLGKINGKTDFFQIIPIKDV
jgi:hypothetical protein